MDNEVKFCPFCGSKLELELDMSHCEKCRLRLQRYVFTVPFQFQIEVKRDY